MHALEKDKCESLRKKCCEVSCGPGKWKWSGKNTHFCTQNILLCTYIWVLVPFQTNPDNGNQ